MTLSAWIFFSDLLPKPQTILEKTIKKSFFSDLSQDEAVDMLRAAGVEGMELLLPSHVTSDELRAVERIAERKNFPVYSVHQALANLLSITLADIQQLCVVAKQFGARVVVLHSNALGRRLFDPRFVEALKQLQEHYGVHFAIENMPKNPGVFWQPYSWRSAAFSDLLAQIDLHATLDTTHLAQSGYDIFEFFQRNQPRIKNIHLSDYKKTILNRHLMLTKDTHLPIGQGELRLDDFLRTLTASGYDGLITMEINSTLDGICDSARTISRFIRPKTAA